MTWQDYEETASESMYGVGILDGTYVMKHSIQSGMAFDFYQITKEEYDNYGTWCKDEEKIMDIRLRKVWYRGFFGHSEFRNMEK